MRFSLLGDEEFSGKCTLDSKSNILDFSGVSDEKWLQLQDKFISTDTAVKIGSQYFIFSNYLPPTFSAPNFEKKASFLSVLANIPESLIKNWQPGMEVNVGGIIDRIGFSMEVPSIIPPFQGGMCFEHSQASVDLSGERPGHVDVNIRFKQQHMLTDILKYAVAVVEFFKITNSLRMGFLTAPSRWIHLFHNEGAIIWRFTRPWQDKEIYHSFMLKPDLEVFRTGLMRFLDMRLVEKRAYLDIYFWLVSGRGPVDNLYAAFSFFAGILDSYTRPEIQQKAACTCGGIMKCSECSATVDLDPPIRQRFKALYETLAKEYPALVSKIISRKCFKKIVEHRHEIVHCLDKEEGLFRKVDANFISLKWQIPALLDLIILYEVGIQESFIATESFLVRLPPKIFQPYISILR